MISETHSVSDHLLGPVKTNNFDETFLFNVNRHAFDRVSAKALFEAKFGNTLFKENTLNIVVGTDSGLLLKYVQSREFSKGSRYIFIETDDVLRALYDHNLVFDLSDRINCVSLEGWGEAIKKFNITDYFYINAVHVFNAICAQDDFISEYAELSWHVTEVISKLHWEASTSVGQEEFIKQQINNLPDNKMPAKLLHNSFCGRTVILLAGGPSLDDSLPWVKQHRTRIVVFAVSRISRQLLDAGIEPDFVFSIDPQDISFDVSKEMFNFSENTTFIYSYHAVSSLISQWQGPMFYLGERVPWDSFLNVANFSSVGPTVTNSAMQVAYELGFKRVLLAGVDFCYTKDGFTHAKGSNEYIAGPKLNLTTLQVETNAGYMAPTGYDYLQSLEALEAQARLLVLNGSRVINVSAGSAKIKGIDYIPLTDIQLEDGDIDASKVVSDKSPKLFNDSKYLAKVLEDLKRAEFHIGAIARLSKEAKQVNDEMYNDQGFIVDYKYKKKLDQIEKKFKHEHRHFARLVKRFGVRRFMQVIKPFCDEDWSAEEARSLGRIYYEAYQEGARKLLHFIREAIGRVISRQQELCDTPDFAMIFAQYKKDRSFGRVRFLKRRALADFSQSEILKVYDEFDQQFIDAINHKDSQHLMWMKGQSNLGLVRQRAGLLFKHKKIYELRNLQVSLEKHEQQQAAEPYKCLVSGYLAELENKADEALDAYHKIVDGGDVLLEDALIRIADICIDHDDASNANLALQCLSELNPIYLPFYAEMRRLHGDAISAIDAYNSYISQFPQDTLVQMKLARFYMECNVYDGAEMMLDFILQQKPDYEAAISMKRQLAVSRVSH